MTLETPHTTAAGIDAALAIAERAHDGQLDRLGHPYITHPTAVAAHLDTVDERITGLLHDVVEDSDITIDDLREAGFTERILAAVDALSKRPGEPLELSMRRVCDEPTGLALRVKRADLSHNASPARLAALDPSTRARLADKYNRSAELLGTTLAAILAELAAPDNP